MLLVKTYLASSKIHGIGLFAGQNIKKGKKTLGYTAGFDSALNPQKVKRMPQSLRDFIYTYASLSMTSHKYILGNDNVRFTNHSTSPNLEAVKIKGEVEKIARAKRDIKKGEELTIDYRTFDKEDATGDKGYLN